MCDHKPPSVIFDSALDKVEPRLACTKLANKMVEGERMWNDSPGFVCCIGMTQISSRVFFTA